MLSHHMIFFLLERVEGLRANFALEVVYVGVFREMFLVVGIAGESSAAVRTRVAIVAFVEVHMVDESRLCL